MAASSSGARLESTLPLPQPYPYSYPGRTPNPTVPLPQTYPYPYPSPTPTQVTRDLRGTTVGPEFQEAQRRYRRTVFNGPDWLTHRSTARFEKSIKTLFDSGIIRSRYKELIFVGAVAAATIAINVVTTGYMDFDGVKQPALIPHLPTFSIPISLFTLTSPTLGLLLVFRTNACYARWDDSRKIWGDIITPCPRPRPCPRPPLPLALALALALALTLTLTFTLTR